MAATLAAVVLAVTASGCGDGDGDGTSATAEAEGPAGSVAPAEPEPAPEDDGDSAAIQVQVAGGEVVGGVQAVEVGVGAQVTLHVVADVADEVHVHGYDVTQAIVDGQATAVFVADIPGQFEIELERSGLPLVELTVR